MNDINAAISILILAGSLIGGGMILMIFALIAYWWMNGKPS